MDIPFEDSWEVFGDSAGKIKVLLLVSPSVAIIIGIMMANIHAFFPIQTFAFVRPHLLKSSPRSSTGTSYSFSEAICPFLL